MLPKTQKAIRLYDFEPDLGRFREEVLQGLTKPKKEISSKFLYDERGSRLFDEICELEEYYPTRTEASIMQRFGGEMAELLGKNCLLIEYGSGSSIKTRLLLDLLETPTAYVPFDISREHLLNSARTLADAYPELEILPVCADYTAYFELPTPTRPFGRRVIFFPGSTVGNFDPEPAKYFLKHIAHVVKRGGGLLIGVDLKKDPEVLHRAYNDRLGVTAQFNLNLLARINQELGADFQLDQFRHYAPYNPVEGRIEMHLISLKEQTVHLGDTEVKIRAGESIWTESSYKYTQAEFAQLAATAGFRVERVWTDPQQLFSVQYLTVQ
jgi:dimethylhistidine N-methyltransferase